MDISTYRSVGAECCLRRRWNRQAKSLPWVAISVAIVAIAVYLQPGLAERMSFDRSAIQSGEIWRVVTGHLTHWSADHLVWDVVMFVVMGAMIERRDRICFVATLLASAIVISLAVWVGHPQLPTYRGLSGLDSALFTLVVAMLIGDARRAGRGFVTLGLAALAIAFVAKVFWELAVGSTLFVDSASAGFTPLPLVHAVGGAMGVLAWFVRARTSLGQRNVMAGDSGR